MENEQVYTDSEIYQMVIKDQTPRLIHELSNYQTVISAEEVKLLSRSELVFAVTALRKQSNNLNACKELVANFSWISRKTEVMIQQLRP